MVMWNLVGHGAKWAIRGAAEFSRTQTGQRFGELTRKAYTTSRDLTKEAVERYRASDHPARSARRSIRGQDVFRTGDVVLLPSGEVALVLRYVEEREIGGAPDNRSASDLLIVGLLQVVDGEEELVVISDIHVKRLSSEPI